MQDKYDLHVHTNYSHHIRRTGLAPKEVISIAETSGMSGLSITDHDSTAAYSEKTLEITDRLGIELIPGIELSFNCKLAETNVCFEGHLLGYYIDTKNNEFKKLEKEMEESRNKRTDRILESLEKQGYDISKTALKRFVKRDLITRDDIVSYLIKKGYANDKIQGYDLIKIKTKGSIRREKPSLEKAVKIILDSGGVPVLAHAGMIIKEFGIWPKEIAENIFTKEEVKNMPENMYTAFDEALKLFLDLGIKGFEIYPYHKVGKGIPLDLSEILNKYFNDINNKYELINGIRGTDCHFQSAKMPAVGEYTTDKEIVIKLNEVSKKNS